MNAAARDRVGRLLVLGAGVSVAGMVIEVTPATDFADVRTMLGPKRPDANVCWCLSYRIPSKQNLPLRGTQRASKVAD